MIDPIDVIVTDTRKAAETLAANLSAMPDDRQDWRPLDAGRSALDQVQECAVINDFCAAILRDRKTPEGWSYDSYKAECAKLDTPAKAVQALGEATERLAAAITAFPSDALEIEVKLPFGDDFRASFLRVILMPYYNMVYHTGQIAYIQTLYGDTQMHGM